MILLILAIKSFCACVGNGGGGTSTSTMPLSRSTKTRLFRSDEGEGVGEGVRVEGRDEESPSKSSACDAVCFLLLLHRSSCFLPSIRPTASIPSSSTPIIYVTGASSIPYSFRGRIGTKICDQEKGKHRPTNDSITGWKSERLDE